MTVDITWAKDKSDITTHDTQTKLNKIIFKYKGTMSNWNREHKVVQYHLLNGKDKNNG